jgi:hypothetical protein
MSEMVEKVARALTGHVCGQCRCSNSSGWANAEADCACRQAARAAIEAMKEPTQAMVGALNYEALCSGNPEDGWRAAIAAALSPSPPPPSEDSQ